MTKLHGMHLIDGTWVHGTSTFETTPVHGDSHHVAEGNSHAVDLACQAAEDAFWDYSRTSEDTRAHFLNSIADEIDARGDAITEVGSAETGLPKARLEGERARTTGQLKLFAQHILKGDYLDKRHDPALPDRAPLPRPELNLVQRPVGPVAVFGASNFPLAFSTAGGDTASALAAGCPVVVKGHPAHPGTSEIVAEAILAAIKSCGMPTGVFNLVHSSNIETGSALVQHPLIQTVGFTGSLRAGRALFDLCAARQEPIPFFGELGSINPVFVLPAALAERAEPMGTAWAGSLTMGVGQFCTNPGVVIAQSGPDCDRFVGAAQTALEEVGPQPMLTPGIAATLRDGQSRLALHPETETVYSADSVFRDGAPSLFVTSGDAWLADPSLGEELFGPSGIVVRVSDQNQMFGVARALHGQLTATLQMNADDTDLAKRLMPILERKAGRILANGFPTGVEVADAMVHGGPYPATTNFGATSVGTMAIRRFLRPVCYQGIPDGVL